MTRKLVFFFVAILSSISGTPNTAYADITYTIHARTDLEINGYSKIQSQIFGLTAYEGADSFDATGIHGNPTGYEFLNDYGVDSIGMVGNIPWVFPRDASIFPTALEPEQVDAWFDNRKSAWTYFNRYSWGDRYVQGRILPTIRRYTTAEPWLYIVGATPHGMDRGHYPLDWDRWALAATGLIGLAKEADPQLTYVHLLNEPNSDWFKTGQGGADYAGFFLKAATAIHNAHPDIKIGGPVLCWPPTWPENQKNTSPWYTWRGYSKPLIDIAHDQLDFFDFHAYNHQADGNILSGELHIITAYAKAAYGKWLRSAITESNMALTSEQWNNRTDHYNLRTVPMIRQTLILLKHPDKVFARQIHDFSARGNGNYKFRGAGNLDPTPMMEFYKIMKPLRGTRLFVDGHNDRYVLIEAVRNEKNIILAIFNDTNITKHIYINLKNIPAKALDNARAEILDKVSLRKFSSFNNKNITMPRESLVVITYPLDKPLKSRGKVVVREFFADSDIVMKKIPDTRVTECSIAVEERGELAGTTLLCFGIKGSAALETWRINIDGESYMVNAPGPYYELPLKRPIHPGKTKVILTQTTGGSNRSDYISFVSLKITSRHSNHISDLDKK